MASQSTTSGTNMVVTVLAGTRPYIGAKNGLITLQIEVPLYVWTEILTHRRFARNASSARAMSTGRYVGMGYYTPPTFYKTQKGMQSSDEPIKYQTLARLLWHSGTKIAQWHATALERLGVAKEQRNRLIPPNKMIRGIVTGTEGAWNAFLTLRNHNAADRAMQEFASLVDTKVKELSIRALYIPSGVLWDTEVLLDYPCRDKWIYSYEHRPYPDLDNISTVARLARVSYAQSTGKDDQALYDKLLADGHMSPFEHVAYYKANPESSCYTCRLEDLEDSTAVERGWESLRASWGA